jgi:hypothetical protein
VFSCLLCTGDALAFTVIVAKYRSTITADTADQAAIAQERLAMHPPQKYSNNGRAIASVVFLWLGLVFTIAR